MEEELNEHELEERLYAMLHHVDETQNNLIDSNQNKFDGSHFADNCPRSTVRRYWRTDTVYNPYQKVTRHDSKDSAPLAPKIVATQAPKTPAMPAMNKPATPACKNPATPTIPAAPVNTRPKEESNSKNPPSPVDLSIFQSPIPQNVKTTIEYLEHEIDPVVLESSDEDEVVEVALPPKPTITIESSDEEMDIAKPKSPNKVDSKQNPEHKSSSGERVSSASPVPSVVSSVSDEFIRGDCIALNISSRHPDKHSFDFSLHGSDLLIQSTPSKKKKRKKTKEAVTSTPNTSIDKPVNVSDSCFATPKSKAKNKKQKRIDKSIPICDVYDSDSNHYIIDNNKNKNPYIVTEKSVPSVDVYESDSNSEIPKENNSDQSKKKQVSVTYSSDTSNSNDKPDERGDSSQRSMYESCFETVDLTNNDSFITIDNTTISESIVMGNVTGLFESFNEGDESKAPASKDISKYVSSKVPSILNEDLDFDNLKGKEKICTRRRYSLTTLRAEMEKFYNESWGGEDFNHREIQKNMSRDKSLWAIDPKDRMPSLAQRKIKCNYCNRVGHRDDTCRQRPAVCYMCGNTGHFEPRCPTKICVNCGAPNFMYSTMCRNCSSWGCVKCAECGQRGHPASHCPDHWRRYHNTISPDQSLETCMQTKKHYQQFCSGCSRRGHLVHACRVSLPFSGLPINSPYVHIYRPIFTQNNKRTKSLSEEPTHAQALRPEGNKRLSKSPAHETHQNKKRIIEEDKTKHPNPPKEADKKKAKSLDASIPEKAPDFIAVSSNHDNEGHVIQDNEVSDTSDAVTSARVYVTADIVDKLKAKDGENWLKTTCHKLNVSVEHSEINSFLNIKGKFADQEAFQTELREWTLTENKENSNQNNEKPVELSAQHLLNVPKNRDILLQYLSKALDSLNKNLGDPQALYKELMFCQDRHQKLMKQKVISPKALNNSRSHINDMLKKLNTVLLGQAGLADGSQHVRELRALMDTVMNCPNKRISPGVRKEIGEHYNVVFSPSARDDYGDLVKTYYTNRINLQDPKKKAKKIKPSKRKLHGGKTQNTIPSENIDNTVAIKNTVNKKVASVAKGKKAKILNQLVTYHRKLQKTKATGPGSKVARNEKMQAMRKMHVYITMLFKNEAFSSKHLKKAMKAQQQARKVLGEM